MTLRVEASKKSAKQAAEKVIRSTRITRSLTKPHEKERLASCYFAYFVLLRGSYGCFWSALLVFQGWVRYAKKVGTLARHEFPFSGAFGLSRFVQAGKLLAKILNLGQIIYNDVRLSWMIGQVVLMVVFGFVKR